MISPKLFYEVLKANKVSFFTGVPDSLLKEFCAYIEAKSTDSSHVIAANEGSAIAIATGHYLASGTLSMVKPQKQSPRAPFYCAKRLHWEIYDEL